MLDFIKNLRPSDFKLIQHAAAQIAGRKAKRHAPNFQVSSEERRKGRHSPWKDLADAHQSDVAKWVNEDGHKHVTGGSLSEAFQHTIHVMHKRVHPKTGGSFDLSDLHNNKITRTLGNLAETARVNVDVTADDFLNRIGLRHERKYKDGKITTDFRDHARIHKDAYKSLEDREGTADYNYLRKDSTDKYATYRHKKSGKVVVAFRGTSPKQALNNNDLVEDGHIAAGDIRKASDYGSYKQHIENMLDVHGDGNVSLSGYSLGGAKAEALTQEKSLRSRLGQTISIAGGASPLDDSLRQKARDSKISHIYHHNDGVANAKLQHSGTNHTVLYSEGDAVKSHMLLDRLANAKVDN